MELSNHCKYKQDKICSFVGFAECKDAQRADPKHGIKEANIVYNLFSLKDGIDFSNYLISTVIGFEKSQSRFPTCGGKVQIAALTPREFQFVNLDESIDLAI